MGLQYCAKNLYAFRGVLLPHSNHFALNQPWMCNDYKLSITVIILCFAPHVECLDLHGTPHMMIIIMWQKYTSKGEKFLTGYYVQFTNTTVLWEKQGTQQKLPGGLLSKVTHCNSHAQWLHDWAESRLAMKYATSTRTRKAEPAFPLSCSGNNGTSHVHLGTNGRVSKDDT